MIFSCSAGIVGSKKKQRRRKHVCNSMGLRFGSFFYKYYFTGDNRFFSRRQDMPRIFVILKCKYAFFLIFYKAFSYAMRRINKFFYRLRRRF